ncbi:Na+/H+ antiporter subunit C [Stenotrophomonas sp. ISL-67]|uniref:Na+/H+ antiporter subunit C n=1 Tax=Stenotrophomonas sp. ISL-67 TaxID=2819171 RepID=UPI001BE9F9D6|nr:Na+/H+ antiporter subunit C [Stenotrophomonas sp. ISL-67]MBT2767900.1 Na+/H+ antiporter subunit C [Stenotrophomonas sp. ISL-67]
MELALASAIGVLGAIGIYLLLRARTFDVILGMTFLSYATNLLIFSGGRLVTGKAPVLKEGLDSNLSNYTDPLPQALVLTAIVIAFAMTAVSIVLAMRSRSDNHSDHVDAHEDEAAERADTAPGREGGP